MSLVTQGWATQGWATQDWGQARTAPTVAQAHDWATNLLRQALTDDPRRDAAVLLGAQLKGRRPWQDPEIELSPQQWRSFRGQVRRRRAHEPVARILGHCEFFSLPFALSPATFQPRPESECLLEAVMALRPEPSAVLDIGSGSGCLLLALLAQWPHARGLGLERLSGAVAVARSNAVRLNLCTRAAFTMWDWRDRRPIPEAAWPVILANPPYLTTAELRRAMPEVAFYDPPESLDGGADGLAAYRHLAPLCAHKLAPGGILALEHGIGQAAAVAAIFARQGLSLMRRVVDLAGIDRGMLMRLQADA